VNAKNFIEKQWVLSSVGLERPDKRVGKVTDSNSVAQPVNAKNFIEKQWVLSSVGLERPDKRVGKVTGSNSVAQPERKEFY
jgi:hypothetical protein